MKKAVLVARILMALPLIVFGLNGFLQFMEQPEHGAEAGAFLGALAGAGYIFPIISGVQVLSGLCFLSGMFVPLALVLFAPILVNIVGFHVNLDPAFANSAPGYLLLVLELFLAYAYWKSFSVVLQARAGTRFD